MDGSPADGSLATSPTGRSRRGGILLDEEPVFGLARPASPVVSPREALGSPAVKLGTTPRAQGGAFFASDEGEALRLARASYEASEAPKGGGRPARGAPERRPERPSRLVRQVGDVGGRRSSVPAEAARRPVGAGPEGGLGARRASFGGDRRFSFFGRLGPAEAAVEALEMLGALARLAPGNEPPAARPSPRPRPTRPPRATRAPRPTRATSGHRSTGAPAATTGAARRALSSPSASASNIVPRPSGAGPRTFQPPRPPSTARAAASPLKYRRRYCSSTRNLTRRVALEPPLLEDETGASPTWMAASSQADFAEPPFEERSLLPPLREGSLEQTHSPDQFLGLTQRASPNDGIAYRPRGRLSSIALIYRRIRTFGGTRARASPCGRFTRYEGHRKRIQSVRIVFRCTGFVPIRQGK